MRVTDLPTPAFVVDRAIVARNCERMRQKASYSGVAFRPHVKTHKAVEIGRMQHGGSTGPITVSTLAEAKYFARAGFEDITYAVPIDPEKLSRCAEIAKTVRRLNLLVDHPDAVTAIEEFSRGNGWRCDVFLKVDCGYHRAGVDPDDPASVELAHRLAGSSAIHFHGFLTHAGHSYAARNRDGILAVAAQETAAVTAFRSRVGDDSLVRSVGSTPTASVVDRFTDCDEVRPGNYVFYDAFQAAVGSCAREDVAVSVLATVIGAYPAQNKLMIDAGALALSKDLGANHIDPQSGFGEVCDLQLQRLPMRIPSVSQEHGQVVGEWPLNFQRFPVGTKVRIIPNHSCLTAALYDTYFVVENDTVVEEWHPVRGW